MKNNSDFYICVTLFVAKFLTFSLFPLPDGWRLFLHLRLGLHVHFLCFHDDHCPRIYHAPFQQV